jgi:hypothetical protein
MIKYISTFGSTLILILIIAECNSEKASRLMWRGEVMAFTYKVLAPFEMRMG